MKGYLEMAKRKPKLLPETPVVVATPEVAPRQPSDVEKAYIKEHYIKDRMTPSELYAKLPGVDTVAIDKVIEDTLPPMRQGQTPQQRQEQLAKIRSGAGQLMGHDEANGVVIMTEAASELTDARKHASVPSPDSMARKQPDRIHIINPAKRTR